MHIPHVGKSINKLQAYDKSILYSFPSIAVVSNLKSMNLSKLYA